MSRAVIAPGLLRGTVDIPASKSAAHRAILCAALARGESRISGVTHSADIDATLAAVRALGAKVDEQSGVLYIDGSNTGKLSGPVEIDCMESGSTLRFLLPVAAALGVPARFTGCGRLPERPLSELTGLLAAHGAACTPEQSGKTLPLTLSGRLSPGRYALPGHISSQYVTGLLFALPLLPGESEITLTSPLESAGYVDLTLAMQRRFGVEIRERGGVYSVPQAAYRPCAHAVEGDWSQAAFFLLAAALGGTLSIRGLDPDSAQGDRAALPLFSALGARARFENGVLTAQPGPARPVDVDVSQIPDLAPALAVAMAYAPGRSVICGAARLRAKESDRLAAIAAGLRRMGVRVEEEADRLIIHGGVPFPGGTVDGFCDHRIVMAFAMGAAAAAQEVCITDAQAVEKSYPAFFDDFEKLGGKVHVI